MDRGRSLSKKRCYICQWALALWNNDGAHPGHLKLILRSRGTVKKKEGLSNAIGAFLDDIDGMINLSSISSLSK
jgi:hypothetical protein